MIFAAPEYDSYSDQWKENLAKNFQAGIEKGNSSTASIPDKNKPLETIDMGGGDVITYYAPKKTISVKTTFAEPIQVIKSADEIDENDNLYVMAGSNYGKFKGLLERKGTGGHTNLGSNVAVFSSSDDLTSGAHEGLHQLGLPHSLMPSKGRSDGGPIDYPGLNHMGDSYNNNFEVLPIKSILKKIEKAKIK